MAQKFVIDGGRPLEGEVSIGGSKNTILPLIAAGLLTAEPVTLENVPEISDVETMLKIAEGLGADVFWERKRHRLTMQAGKLTSDAPDAALSRILRGSILFAGALIGRQRHAQMPHPGGDTIGARPLTTHTRSLEALGVSVEEEERIVMDGAALRGGDIILEESSVTATENILLASVLAPGTTVIRLVAQEPHVQELITLLQKMGAEARWDDIATIVVKGVERLGGATHVINADELEVSSFAALAAATRSELSLIGIDPRYLHAILLQLKKMGVAFELSGKILKICKPFTGYKSFRIQSGLYPKLGSDHLPPFAVLATQAEGTSLIHDWLYEDRLRYIRELQKMGADCTLLDQHRALVTGPTRLSGCEIATFDIRSGMTLIIAGLLAEGRSVISNIEHIDRGYERIDERLRALGASIERISK